MRSITLSGIRIEKKLYFYSKKNMNITRGHEFETKVASIYAFFSDESLIKAKMEALGARNIEIEIEKVQNGIKVLISREMPAEIPGPLKNFIQPWNKVTQTELWNKAGDNSYHCNMEMQIEGAPVKIKGQMSLTETTIGCYAESSTDIKVKVPFFKKLLSKFVLEMAEKSIQDEFDYINRFLT